jgi:hypothetical protein
MSNTLAPTRPESAAGARHALCFVVDTDFGFLQGFAKSLRGLGVNAVEFVNSARLGENVENQNPDIVFINLNAADPYDCTRALLSLWKCKFSGRVQLFGRCEPAFLESFRKTGSDAALTMLPVLQKPIDFAAVRKIVQEQKLNAEPVSPPDLSLKKAIAGNWINFLYQPQVDLKKKMVASAETFVRVCHPQHGLLSPARFMGVPAKRISPSWRLGRLPCRSRPVRHFSMQGCPEVRGQHQCGDVGQAPGCHPDREISSPKRSVARARLRRNGNPSVDQDGPPEGKNPQPAPSGGLGGDR